MEKDKVTLTCAKVLASLIEKKAAEMGVQAVIAVADAGANLIYLERMDDGFLASLDIAADKAYTAVALKTATSALKPLAQPGGSLYGIQNLCGNRIVIFGGGEPLTIDSRIVGGLGVSGGTEEQDTALGQYGAAVFPEVMKYL